MFAHDWAGTPEPVRHPAEYRCVSRMVPEMDMVTLPPATKAMVTSYCEMSIATMLTSQDPDDEKKGFPIHSDFSRQVPTMSPPQAVKVGQLPIVATGPSPVVRA